MVASDFRNAIDDLPAVKKISDAEISLRTRDTSVRKSSSKPDEDALPSRRRTPKERRVVEEDVTALQVRQMTPRAVQVHPPVGGGDRGG